MYYQLTSSVSLPSSPSHSSSSFKTLYNIHAIVCHPTEMCVATGNERGEIVLWWQWSHRTKPPVMTVLHWHAHTVADLCFTSDGRYLSSPSPLFPFPFSPPLSLSLSPSPSLSLSLPSLSLPSPYPLSPSVPPPSLSIGTYLLSGGEECVLVVWQLASQRSHYRPRLGAQITRVACSPEDKSFAVSLQNNSNTITITIII